MRQKKESRVMILNNWRRLLNWIKSRQVTRDWITSRRRNLTTKLCENFHYHLNVEKNDINSMRSRKRKKNDSSRHCFMHWILVLPSLFTTTRNIYRESSSLNCITELFACNYWSKYAKHIFDTSYDKGLPLLWYAEVGVVTTDKERYPRQSQTLQ
jgi:hypothetical protein